jgi:hypothetical protein
MKKPSSRKILISALTLVGLLIVAEVLLRTLWGFGNMILFFEDPTFEYLAVPNQNSTRFGNRISYNEFSQRSKPVSESDSCVVLGIGDSVINGGTLTDQDSLATTIVENQFDGRLRFLNISAGSWGPDNGAAYVKKYGDFKAKMIILFVSSHDAHDNITGEKTVGVHEAYPDHQYPLAMIEVLDKYIIPRVSNMLTKSSQPENLMINKNGVGFNKGFQKLYNHARQAGIPFVVCLHAEKGELNNHSFNEQGKEILAFCAANNIKVVTGFEVGERVEFYRDDIHLNDQGQKAWVSALSKEIRDNISCAK